MKKLLSCLMLAIFMCCGSACAGGSLRVHVIGATDLYCDQQYKLTVRDWALEYIDEYGPDDIHAIEGYLNEMAASVGREKNIKAERGIFPYPETVSGGRTYPYGDYDALRIYIGAAAGRNWWGMLYPEHSGLDEDVIYYSAIVNWLMRLLGTC